MDGKICADIIILSHLIQHLDNPKKFLKLLYDHVIVDGGYIYLEVPGIKRIDFQKERQVSHLWYWNLNNLKMLMNKIGFDMVTGDESIQSIFIR